MKTDNGKTVSVTVNGVKVHAAVGTKLSELTAAPLLCGGHGKCGKCKVRAAGALSPITETESEHLTEEEIALGVRLACCTVLLGEADVESMSEKKTENVLTDGEGEWVGIEPTFRAYGVSVDIGTTTLAAKLWSARGKLLASCGRANQQAAYGADVISRIESAMAGNAESLANILAAALDAMIEQMAAEAKIPPRDIDGIVMTGNTAMLYLLTKTSPSPLSRAPFTLTRAFGETVCARDLGLCSVRGETEVYLPPCISAFVGADTVCALLSSHLCESASPAMLADIGTNGEMALWNDGKLKVCSTAAGPAFEGVGISMGVCGSVGAVDRVTVEEGKLKPHVIGEGAPLGICGSGIVDAVAALLEIGRLDEGGYLEDDPAEVAPGVVLTQKDIRAVQLAKSAIGAGLATLLHEANAAEDEIESLAVAGGFGNFLNKESAGKIGLLPASLVPRTKSVGNAALGGASILLLNRSERRRAERIVSLAEAVDLSASRFFSETYMLGMTFPEN